MVQPKGKNKHTNKHKAAAELGKKCGHLHREKASGLSWVTDKHFEKYFSFIFSHKRRNSCRKWKLTLPGQKKKKRIAHFESWHMAVCLALQSKSGILLEPYGWIKKGNGFEQTEGSSQVMIKSWGIICPKKLPVLDLNLKGGGCQKIHQCVFLLKWENKYPRQSTTSQLCLDDLTFQSPLNQLKENSYF